MISVMKNFLVLFLVLAATVATLAIRGDHDNTPAGVFVIDNVFEDAERLDLIGGFKNCLASTGGQLTTTIDVSPSLLRKVMKNALGSGYEGSESGASVACPARISTVDVPLHQDQRHDLGTVVDDMVSVVYLDGSGDFNLVDGSTGAEYSYDIMPGRMIAWSNKHFKHGVTGAQGSTRHSLGPMAFLPTAGAGRSLVGVGVPPAEPTADPAAEPTTATPWTRGHKGPKNKGDKPTKRGRGTKRG
jgi:hypothetical protein